MTIANFQWFLRRPSPLNIFRQSDHCYQWFFNGFATNEPSPLNVFSLINHWHQWFSNGFHQSLARWSTMVLARSKGLKKLATATFWVFSQINLMKAKGDKWISQIMSKFPCHFADWRKSLNFWTFKTTICYHCKVSMVFKGTITIEWNGLGRPLGSMVFRWFWGHATIGFDG